MVERTVVYVRECCYLKRIDFWNSFCMHFYTMRASLALERIWFGAHPAFHPMGTRGFFPGAKRQGREANHSPPSNAEVKNGGAVPPLRMRHMVWCLVKQAYGQLCLYRIRKFAVYHKSLPMDSTLIQAKPVHIFTTYLRDIHLRNNLMFA
jgi:hypothetical protein